MTWQQRGVCFSFASSLFLIPYRSSFPSTQLSFPRVWCLLVGVEGQEQLLNHVHCEGTRVLSCAWPWHTCTQVPWVRTAGFVALPWIRRRVALFVCHTWENHPTTVTWVKHLSCCPGFTSQQWGPFRETVHLPAAWVEKASNNSASEALLFKQSFIYEDFPLKNRCPLAWGKAINVLNYILNQELI